MFRGAESIHRDITVGVPQGSILGPLFFLIYVNDMSKASLVLRHILFADDTNQYISGRTRNELYRSANSELRKVSNWVAHNKLTLNYEKTEYIEFSKNRTIPIDNHHIIKIDGRIIKKVVFRQPT